ncbi:MAG: PDGLE domain-containing protein [Candidatus Bathyarchaeota archaeon]|nr:PDGLE domain-containing protein [Candidatus Bathyarchaeota archaeon]
MKTLIFLVTIILVSPIFGVILADIVGFHEPLDIAAEKVELHDLSKDMNWTPLFDYTIPGLSPEIGYIISGLLGIAIILGAGLVFKGRGKQH